MEEERCPGCRGLMIDGVCPYCSSPIPGLGKSEPERPRTPPPPPGSPAVGVVMAVMAGLAGLYWIGMGAWLLKLSLSTCLWGGGLFGIAAAAVGLVLGVYSCQAAWSMVRRSYTAQGQLALASLLGICWAVLISVLFEYWLFSVIIPVHLFVGIVALIGSRHFGNR